MFGSVRVLVAGRSAYGRHRAALWFLCVDLVGEQMGTVLWVLERGNGT